MTHDLKIRWAPRLRPQCLKRLYDSDAQGFQDMELCDDVGMTLFMRCRTFVLVHQNQVECPACHTVFAISPQGESHCPKDGCDWYTTGSIYAQSIRNHTALHPDDKQRWRQRVANTIDRRLLRSERHQGDKGE